MTIRRSRNLGSKQARDTFVDEAAAADTERLHCFIPSDLHYQVKVVALEGRTSMTALVVEALQGYVAEHRP